MNKIPLLISLFLLGFQLLIAQEVAIENQRLNYAYPAIGNYLNVVVENEDCENVVVETDNGTVEKREGLRCSFVFIPDSIGWATLSVYVGTTRIGHQIYRVKRWPEHKPYYGRSASPEKMSRAEFLAYGGVHVPIQHFDISGHLTVVSYKIAVARGGERIYELENFGGKFEEDNYKILEDVKAGDTVFISEIKVKVPGEYQDVSVGNLRIEIVK